MEKIGMEKENNEELFKSHEILMEGLSPLFIGSGKKYSQLDYIPEGNKIHIINFEKLLSGVPIEFIDDLTNDINENFQNNIWNKDVQEFLDHYQMNWKEAIKKSLDLVGSIGKNEIHQFITSCDRPYIPGSSLKGALRTAILFDVLKSHQHDSKRILDDLVNRSYGAMNDRHVQNLIRKNGKNRKNAKTDLLRALSISDLTVMNCKTCLQIMESKVYHLKNKQFTIPMFYEMLKKGFISKGAIKINTKLIDSNILETSKFNLQKENIISTLNEFSKELITYELSLFKKQNDANLTPIISYYEELRQKINTLNSNEAIIRLGQGSSILGITVLLNYPDSLDVKNWKIFRFDRINKQGQYFTRDKGYNIYIDRNSPKPQSKNEQWLCRIGSIDRKKKYIRVFLIERIQPQFNMSDMIFPLTRKFVMIDDKATFPFGWIKLTWN